MGHLRKMFFTIAFSIFCMALGQNVSSVDISVDDPTGLLPLNKTELSKLKRNQIRYVLPNERALQRINEDRVLLKLEEIEQKTWDDDYILYLASSPLSKYSKLPSSLKKEEVQILQQRHRQILPEKVDNSELPSFPKIGHQGSMSSCASWATTYYQMSHQVCLKLGCDNQNLNELIFSPSWTYNMVNEGVDAGSYLSDNYSMLNQHGSALWTQFPYLPGHYKAWDSVAKDWIQALNYRTMSFASLQIRSEWDMNNVKQLLANGDVLVFGTYIASWKFGTILNTPGQASALNGLSVVTHVAGNQGPHAMTLVGYDDSIWVDINGNGLVEVAEMGAFKIANSWGAFWGHQGFMWASYDAFRPTSQVPDFNPQRRVPLTRGYGLFHSGFAPYAPRLVGKITVSHAARNQMSFQFGASSLRSQSPQKIYSPFALNQKGGAYAFDGSSQEIAGTFYFDLSSLLPNNLLIEQQKYFLKIMDSQSGHPITLSSFELIDPSTGQPLMSHSGIRIKVDAGSYQITLFKK